jgi:broad specificity phosphatase PhoE
MNPDDDDDPPLSAAGEQAAFALVRELAGERFELVAHSPRRRARRTAELVAAARRVPLLELDELAEVGVGALGGQPVERYRAFLRSHRLDEAPPGGESVLDAVGRYLAGYRRLLERPEGVVLGVFHNLPIRLLENALRGEHPVLGPVQRLQPAEAWTLAREQLEDAVAALTEWAREERGRLASGRTL